MIYDESDTGLNKYDISKIIEKYSAVHNVKENNNIRKNIKSIENE